MEDIEIGITDMKARQAESYKDLQRDEKSLCAEIEALQKRIFLTKAPPAPILEESTHDLPPEVKDFEMFVACTGGLSGGWDDFDQGTFVRIYCAHKGHPTMKQFLAGLPTKTEAEVHRHVGWYMEYQGLLAKKKEAIQKWRQKKEFEKTILAKEAMTKLTEAEEEKEKAKKMIQLKEEIQNTKIAIHRWKMEKNLAKEDEDRKKDQERARIRMEEEKKQQERRAFMEVYSRQKQDLKMKMEEESRKMDTLTKLKEKMSEAERKENVRQNIARFQERDQAVLKKKMDQVRAREQESEEREARLIKLIGDQVSLES
ncbi:hypothetical protein LSAT2_006899 [Lamellibrachia satsuma]|nr:hypothetical protein LSAT2_006899 [Lamellibrachia satsuma]